ncbi:MAG: 50S ribosomal protein L21 [bacterium]|nr:50S ribosomal protein L21 [bacterium]
MMYAVVTAGGRQLKVRPDEKLRVDFLPNTSEGEQVVFDKILLVSNDQGIRVGSPFVDGVVRATVLSHGRDDKVIVYKKKKRVDYHKKQGNRQDFTTVRIDSIEA